MEEGHELFVYCVRLLKNVPFLQICIVMKPTTRCRGMLRYLQGNHQTWSKGRVAGSHLTSMHSLDNYYFTKLISLVEADLNIIANPLINITIQIGKIITRRED